MLRPKEILYMILVTVPPLLMLFIPNYANIYLGIDAWWIFAVIAVIDVVFAWVITKIARLCPDQSVVGMCKYAFGNAVELNSTIIQHRYKKLNYFTLR